MQAGEISPNYIIVKVTEWPLSEETSSLLFCVWKKLQCLICTTCSDVNIKIHTKQLVKKTKDYLKTGFVGNECSNCNKIIAIHKNHISFPV